MKIITEDNINKFIKEDENRLWFLCLKVIVGHSNAWVKPK